MKTNCLVIPSLRAFLLLALCNCRLSSASAASCSESLGGLVYNRVLSGTVCVTNDVSLSNVTALPDTVIYLATNATIRVLGPVFFVGTPYAPVTVTLAPGNTNGWQGFYFENTAPGTIFDCVRIDGARNSALTLVRSMALVQNCSFSNNYGSFGGAISATLTGGDLVISNCAFSSNYGVNDGGAVWATAGTGTVHFVKCTFADNAANYPYQRRDTQGGAVWIQGNYEFTRCGFTNDRAHSYTIYAASGRRTQGGAIWASGIGTVTACSFLGNACEMAADGFTPDTSYAWGGAVYLASGSMVMSNSLLAENWLSASRSHVYKGSAIYVAAGSLVVANCTVANNSAAPALHNEAGSVTVRNSILYFNNDHVVQLSGTAVVTYSDVQGGFPGMGNIDYNPVFDGSYRIIPGSPCVDAGDPAYSDVAFPPSLGTARSDMGMMGGPGAQAWIDVPYTGPQQVFRVDLGNVVTWTDRPNTVLQHAADARGPWVPYTGTILTVGAKRVVVLDPVEPQRFFRLATTY